jgi:hypothetical protein
MNRKGEMNVGQIVILVMGIIAVLALMGEIFIQQNVMTQKAVVTNEAISIAPARLAAGAINTTYPFRVTNYPTGWKIGDCPISGVTYGNASVDYTVTTDYTFNATTGVLLLKNTLKVNNTLTNSTNIDYLYCRDGYNKDTGSRSIAGMIGIFAALALLAYVIQSGKISDLMNSLR